MNEKPPGLLRLLSLLQVQISAINFPFSETSKRPGFVPVQITSRVPTVWSGGRWSAPIEKKRPQSQFYRGPRPSSWKSQPAATPRPSTQEWAHTIRVDLPIDEPRAFGFASEQVGTMLTDEHEQRALKGGRDALARVELADEFSPDRVA